MRTFAVLWLIVQMAVPAQYYIYNTDPLDEAYAWRMFSDTHHGASRVKWYAFAATDPHTPATLISRTLMTQDAGMAGKWADFACGKRGAFNKSPPVWMLDYVARHLCATLRTKPRVIAARRTVVPWEGDMYDEDFQWMCDEEKI